MSYSFSEQFQKLERDQNVILANRYTGEWFRITKILYDALILYIECPEKINFECEDDGKAIKKFVETLCKARILYDVTQAPPKYALEPDISFAITNNCNLACTHCSYSAGKYSKDLTTDEILSIIDSLLECNPCSITITGGEPMIRKDFLEIAEYLKNSFSGTKILMTNGTLIHEQNIDVVINAFDKIDISIDGTDEKSCEEIRGKGVYNKVIKSIKLLHTKDYNDISLSMVFFEKDKLLSERFMDLCSDLKVSPLPRSFIALGRGYDNLNNIYNTNSSETIRNHIDSLLFNMAPSCVSCKAGMVEYFIDYDGNVYPCPLLKQERHYLFNILREKSLYQEHRARKKLIDGINPMKHQKCGDCDINLFCWRCPAYISSYEEDEELFHEWCDYHKKIIAPRVWEDI